MKSRSLIKIFGILAALVIVVSCVAAAGNAGSKEDPLVTYSYVNETFKNEVLSEANGGYVLVTLQKGQTLHGAVGTEVMLRVGTAVCTASSAPGLIDTTDASTINDGKSIEKNHVYMMTIEERGIRATANTVKVLVRGTYSVTE